MKCCATNFAASMATLLIVTWSFSLTGCGTATAEPRVPFEKLANVPDPAEAKPKCELRLELPAKIEVSKPGAAKITIKNVSREPVTLVLPGDGSECKWRTPVVAWSFVPVDPKDERVKRR